MYINQEIGKQGEIVACRYLQERGYKILTRNFKCKQGEVDIIAWDENADELVFIEVKTRTSSKYGMPADAVNEVKQKHIYRSAEYYVYRNRIKNVSIRLDIIEIHVYESRFYINHIKQAFEKRQKDASRSYF